MTNTHRMTTNRTTAKIAAVGAFGIGAAIAFPGLTAAQETAPESPTASLENLAGDESSLGEGSIEGVLGRPHLRTTTTGPGPGSRPRTTVTIPGRRVSPDTHEGR